MADLSTVLTNVIQEVGTDIKTLKGAQGSLTALTTGQKASLVLAINELKAALDAIDVQAVINDSAASGTTTYSSNKIVSEINAKCQEVKDALLGGAGEAYDTLKELSDLIATNKDAIAALQKLAGAHVRYDQAQTIAPEKQQIARSNIGAASAEELAGVKTTAESANSTATANKTAIGTLASLGTTAKTDLVSAVNEVKGVADGAATTAGLAKTAAETAQSAASKAQGDIDAFKTAVGDTSVDLVAIYQTARDGVSA